MYYRKKKKKEKRHYNTIHRSSKIRFIVASFIIRFTFNYLFIIVVAVVV